MEQTNRIREQRQRQQVAWNIDVQQSRADNGERTLLNHRNFKIWFHHASQYKQVHNAYYALLNHYHQVSLNFVSTK